jgi:RHS repeat-associated protein
VALTYAYDAANRATTLQDSLGGVLTSVYDNASRLTTREFGGAGQTPLRIDLGYDNADRLTGLTRYSNLAGTSLVGTTSYAYDAASRMTGIVSKNSSLATVSYYNYQYDNADRVTVQSGTGATGTYSYDAASQVLSDGTKAYSYDGNGNRNMAGYQTGTDNQTTNDGTYTYTYDAVGNLTGKSNSTATWSYGYDGRNHLTSVRQTSDGTTNQLLVTYTYDVYGQRIEEDKWTSGTGTVATRFVWSGTQVMLDMSGSNVVQERYLWGDTRDQLLARIDGDGTAHWALTDRLGSVRDWVNASGTSEDHLDYSAYGVITTESNSAVGGSYKYDGYYTVVGTGLDGTLNRWYDPATGRWLTLDPKGFDAGDTNLNRYCGNEPTNATDPMGLEPLHPARYKYGTTLNLDTGWQDREATLDFFQGMTTEGAIKELKKGGEIPANIVEGFVTAKIDVTEIYHWSDDRELLGYAYRIHITMTDDSWNRPYQNTDGHVDGATMFHFGKMEKGEEKFAYRSKPGGELIPMKMTFSDVHHTTAGLESAGVPGKEKTSRAVTVEWDDQTQSTAFRSIDTFKTKGYGPRSRAIYIVMPGGHRGDELLVVRWRVINWQFDKNGKMTNCLPQLSVEEKWSSASW